VYESEKEIEQLKAFCLGFPNLAPGQKSKKMLLPDAL
jgi:hypothetical protein